MRWTSTLITILQASKSTKACWAIFFIVWFEPFTTSVLLFSTWLPKCKASPFTSIRRGSDFQINEADINQRFYDLSVGHLTSIVYKTHGMAQNRNSVNTQLKGLLEIWNCSGSWTFSRKPEPRDGSGLRGAPPALYMETQCCTITWKIIWFAPLFFSKNSI